MACGVQPAPPPSRPLPQQPLGMLQLVIKAVDLEQGSDSCFCLLRCGPLWGRSTTQPSSSHLDFNWEVRSEISKHAPKSLPDVDTSHFTWQQSKVVKNLWSQKTGEVLSCYAFCNGFLTLLPLQQNALSHPSLRLTVMSQRCLHDDVDCCR